jgi:hypothetical protein
MIKLNYEEISIIIEILGDRANMYQFLLSGLFKLENTSKIDKELELINSSIEKLSKEKEKLLYEEN